MMAGGVSIPESALGEMVAEVAERCSVGTVPFILERLGRLGHLLQARGSCLGMLSPQLCASTSGVYGCSSVTGVPRQSARIARAPASNRSMRSRSGGKGMPNIRCSISFQPGAHGARSWLQPGRYANRDAHDSILSPEESRASRGWTRMLGCAVRR